MLLGAGRLFEPLYSRLMLVRARLYQRGVFPVFRAPVPVVSIGNLLMGGTGKTPHVKAVCGYLCSRGFRPAVIIRGYGGRAGRGPLVVSDRRNVHASPEAAGDEPVMLARELSGVPVVAGSDRAAGSRLAVEELEADVLVLDDGFQHMALFRDVDIVLVPAVNPFGNGHVFPGGMLREPPEALCRASCLLITGREQVSDAEALGLRQGLQELCPELPVFDSKVRAARIATVCGKPGANAVPPAKVAALSAIGNPEGFSRTLEKAGIRPVLVLSYPDHHGYTVSDLKRICRRVKASGADAVIITAKDAVKIEPLVEEMRSAGKDIPDFFVLHVEAVPDSGLWRHIDVRLSEYTRKGRA